MVLCIALVGLRHAQAQRSEASLEVTVNDSSGSKIPNAQLQLINIDTNKTVVGTTNESGVYSFLAIEPGRYELTVTAQGMETVKQTGIIVTTGIANQMVVQMNVGHTTETLVVNAGTQMVNTEDAAVSGLVNDQQVQAMPLNQRSLSALVKLEPAVTPGDGPVTSEAGPNTNSGGFVGGQRSFDSAYTVDGGNVMSPTWPQPVWVTITNGGISLDAIREFRIFISNKPADAGGKSGAYIAITTKSGTDKFHGSAFEYLRNTVLDAKNFFDIKRLPYQQNQFGGSLGGPVSKSKGIYFFGNFESFRSKQPLSFNLTVPTPALLAAIPGGQEHGYLQELFANTYPLPNPGYNPSALVATATSTYDDGNTRNMGLGRLDVRMPHQSQLTLRYMQIDGSSGFGSTTALGTAGGNVNEVWNGNNGLVRLSTAISNNMVNEFHVAYDRDVTNFAPAPPPQALVQLGFSSDSATSPFGIPTITINGTGLQPDGPPSWLPNLRYENSFEYADEVSWSLKKHTISFGGQFLKSQDNAIAIGNIRPAATFQGFGGVIDGAPYGITTGVFQSQTQNLFQAGDLGERGYRQAEVAFFANDNYRMLNNLTVNYGLRWTYDTPFTEVKGRLVNVYAANGSGKPIADAPLTLYNVQSVALGQPSADNISFTKKIWTEFAPNFGLNWDTKGNGKTVVSTGYSIAYERPFMYYLQTLGSNVPFVTSTVIQALPFGTVASAGTGGGSTPALNAFNPANRTPYVQYWNFGVQQQMGMNTVLQLTYLGNKGTHMYTDLQLNGGPSFRGTRANTQYSTITQTGTDGIANYNALAVELRHQYSSSLSMQLVYTYAKSLDDASAANLANADFPVNEYDRRGEYGPSAFDLRHVFTGNVLYALPFGKTGSLYRCSAGIACTAASGWQASTIFSFHSGQPFSILSGQDNNNDGVTNDRAFELAPLTSVYQTSGLPKTQFLNPAVIGTEIGITGTNSLSRDSFYGPGFGDVDIEMRKATPLRESLNLTFIAQAFNALNRANFGLPVATASAASFGQLQTTIGTSRVYQFALRLDF